MNGLQKKIIVKALDAGDELTEWEHDFIQQMADRDDDYAVSEKQNHILNRIWERFQINQERKVK